MTASLRKGHEVSERLIEPLSLAISIKQPYAELILVGKKKLEYRNRPTRIRGRVWIYASQKPADDDASWRRSGSEPGELPVGVVVGSVEIVGCRALGKDDYGYVLARPKRCRPWKPTGKPQPVWFRPGARR